MASGRLVDYLGSGIIADRPAAPDLAPGALGLWYATDTDTLSAWDGATWEDVSSGGGSGDVVGPASSTDSYPALFDGTTGKLLKQGTGALGTAAFTAAADYATAAQGTLADSATQPGDLATVATTGDVDDLTGFPGGTTNFLRADGTFAAPPGGGTVSWGGIAGTLSDQTDLQAALDAKLEDAPSDGSIYGRKDGAWEVVADSGDVTGPASSVADRIATFDGTSGKLIKDGGKTIAELAAPKITSTVTSNTITPDGDTDLVRPSATLSAGLTIANPSGTPVDGWGMVLELKDNGTTRSLTWGSKFARRCATLPTATTAGKQHVIGVSYNATDDKLYCDYALVQP